ncbi:MAG TPA: mycothiol synthase [Pedococcus sp.]|nr:mycothiol synthase [Pedococcus sp.]
MATGAGYELSEHDRLDDATRAEVEQLAGSAAAYDGVDPLGEHTLLALTGDGARHLLARADGTLVGYGQLDGAGSVAELVVSPEFRGRGIGRALLEHLLERAPGLGIWAHGDLPGARALASSLGLVRSRGLLQMRRSLDEPLPDVDLPAGFALRSFLPGLDEQEWLSVNARAFTDLPDQGGWTTSDLHQRMAAPWFDPAGFLIATTAMDPPSQGERIAGFHWTKIHDRVRSTGPDAHEHERIGEVYVVGIDPSQQGHGLGRALTLAGLHRLKAAGLSTVMLYVDDANAAAVGLYRALGFATWQTDVEYRRG